MRVVRALALIILVLALCSSGLAETPAVRVLAVDGAVNPVTADYLRKNLHEAARTGERLVLIEMDTPGGLDTAMREIVKELFASPVPVAVFVTPAGARAASAGAVIGLAADVLAMSPGTNLTRSGNQNRARASCHIEHARPRGNVHPLDQPLAELPEKIGTCSVITQCGAIEDFLHQLFARDDCPSHSSPHLISITPISTGSPNGSKSDWRYIPTPRR